MDLTSGVIVRVDGIEPRPYGDLFTSHSHVVRHSRLTDTRRTDTDTYSDVLAIGGI